ncbi:calcium-binding protein, partial [Aphanothece microscopica]|uniref:calcium-binding protein n=1 Tax=Aphanothece microscopica TaxID=1049561 RepID=UPI0039846365
YGNDRWNAGGGSDLLIVNYADATSAVILGTTTNTATSGALLNDTVNGGWRGNLHIDGNRSTDFTGVEHFIITTGASNDTIGTGDGDDSIATGNGADSIASGLGADTIDGGAGNDRWVGSTVEGGDAARSLDLNNATDWQDLGEDLVRSVEGANFTWTGSGARDITTSTTVAYHDAITTGAGNDTFRGGYGNDRWNAGGGSDLLIVNYADATSAVILGTTTNTATS